MGAFDKFKTADPMGVRQYIEPGEHILLVRRAEMGPSKNPQKKNMEKTVVEFKIVDSDTMPKGKVCSLVEVDTSQGYHGNVLSYVAGILGCTIDEMKADPDFDEVFGNAFGEAQLFTDMLVKCIAQQVPTTSATAKSDTYTAKTWEPVHASEYEKYGLVAPNGAYTGPAEAAAA